MKTPSQILVDRATRHLAPPPRISVSQWADANRILSSKSGAAAGKWITKPFQREIFDGFSDPTVQEVVVQASTQMVKTEFVLNALGWVIDYDPGPALVVLPRIEDVKTFSRIRLTPMITDCPTLRAKVSDTPDKHSGDTMFRKLFDGGHVTITAAGSPANLSSLPIRFLLMDEVDKYVYSAGREGDPIDLARKRTATYWNRKVLMVSSPTIAGESRIERAYLESDQRKYEVPCPHCDHYQVLSWPQVRFDSKGSDRERAATARYVCVACGESWNDRERWHAVDRGRWMPTAEFTGTAGFWISELYSPWKRLGDLVSDFLSKKKNHTQLQVFVNTSLAETWRLQGEAPSWEGLYRRRESYPLGVVPNRGLFLTMACDVQVDRIECEICAWGRGRERWSIDYRILPGSPTDTSVNGPWWRPGGVHDLLTQEWPHASGATLRVLCAAIDSGFNPGPVYDFARKHPQPIYTPAGSQCPAFGCVAVTKGTDGADRIVTNVSNADVARQTRSGVRIWLLGTHFLKQETFDLLRLEPIEGTGGADGQQTETVYPNSYIHLPDYSKDYFQSLCSETRVVRQSGKVEWVRDGGIRNEVLDIVCYGRAASEIAGISRMRESDWVKLEARLKPVEPVSTPLIVPGPGQVLAQSPVVTNPAQPPAQQPSQPQAIRPIRGRFNLG